MEMIQRYLDLRGSENMECVREANGLLKELAQYTAAKRKAVEVSGLDGDPIAFHAIYAGKRR